MKAIVSIHDTIKGSWHQVTIDLPVKDWPVGEIRMDGTLMEDISPFVQAVTRMVAEWDDQYEGLTDE